MSGVCQAVATACSSLGANEDKQHSTSDYFTGAAVTGGLALAIPMVTEHYYKKNRGHQLKFLLKKEAVLTTIAVVQNDQPDNKPRAI